MEMNEIKLKGIDETIYYDECDNGLKVYLWVKKTVNTFYGTLSVKYGSIHSHFKVGNKTYNTPCGVAHFLEHIKFNESEDMEAQDFYKKTGCDTNAFTTFDYTNYQVFGSEECSKNIVHLLDFVQNDFFTKSIIKDEKGIIVEEAKTTEDNPYTIMHFNLLNNMFYNEPHKKIITGEPEDVQKISYEDIKLVFNAFYHPANMFLIVTGNFNPYEVMESIKENQNNKTFNKFIKPTRIIKKESKRVVKKYEELEKNVSVKKIKLGIKIPRKSLKEFDDLHIRTYLNILLKANFGGTSDFRDELLNKEIINEMAYSYDIIDDFVTIYFTIESDYKEEVLKLLNEKLDNISIEEKTFKRMKKASIASLILDYEDVEYVNEMLQTEIMYYDKIIDNYKEIYENLKYNDILEFIKLLDLKELSVLIYKPKK